jgi:hypothetical protein
MTQPKPRDSRLELTVEERRSDEVIKLIRKLRWIGLEREASELQQALEGVPSPHRGSLSGGPHDVD